MRKRLRKKTGKKFDTSNFRKVLEQLDYHPGKWGCLGVVVKDGDTHFEIDEGEDVVIEVELQPSGERVSARLGTAVQTAGAGIWSVPPVGAEVFVAFPDGDMEFQPVIVGLYSTGSLPDGVAESTIVIACQPGSKVLIHDGSGGTEPLITKSQFDAHKHPTGVGPSGPPDNAPTSGTTVLESL